MEIVLEVTDTQDREGQDREG
jgi:hypothetical protein